MARAARVLTEVAALDRELDYSCQGVDLGVGDRVRVNLHGRSVRGWVTALVDSDLEMKPVARHLGLGPPPSLVALAEWAAWRYDGPRSRFWLAASGERLVRELPAAPASPPLDVEPATGGIIRLAPTVDPLEHVLAAYAAAVGRGSLVVLVPDTGWASRLRARLERRGIPACLDDEWARARAGWPVVVGTRGAAFAPVPRLGAAVVIDADDDAYRQSAAPTWWAPEILAERCRLEGAVLVATSPLPSPALRRLGPNVVAPDEFARWPQVEVVDRRRSDPRDGALSQAALAAARRALSGGEDVAVAVVLQRLGQGRLLSCAACGALARCATCGAPERDVDGRLGCPEHPPTRERFCRECGATRLKALSSGVTTLARDVAAQLAVPVSEVIAATDPEAPLERVVVGTEAVLRRVRRCALVVMADLDQYLLAPRERARAEAVLTVARAGRLVGSRREGRGRVVVQTRRGQDAVVVALGDGNLDALVAEEDELVEALGLFPARGVADVSGPGAAQFVDALVGDGLEVREGPGGFVVSAPSVASLCDALGACGRPADRVRVAVE